MSATPIILADGVTKRFGTNQVLTRVSLPAFFKRRSNSSVNRSAASLLRP